MSNELFLSDPNQIIALPYISLSHLNQTILKLKFFKILKLDCAQAQESRRDSAQVHGKVVLVLSFCNGGVI